MEEVTVKNSNHKHKKLVQNQYRTAMESLSFHEGNMKSRAMNRKKVLRGERKWTPGHESGTVGRDQWKIMSRNAFKSNKYI